MATGTIRLHRVLRTNPERIYRAFLDADAMAKWLPPYGFTCKVHHMEAKVGGTYRMSFTNFTTGEGHSFGGEYRGSSDLRNALARSRQVMDHPPRSGDHGSKFRRRDLRTGASGLLSEQNPVFGSANLICRRRSTSLLPPMSIPYVLRKPLFPVIVSAGPRVFRAISSAALQKLLRRELTTGDELRLLDSAWAWFEVITGEACAIAPSFADFRARGSVPRASSNSPFRLTDRYFTRRRGDAEKTKTNLRVLRLSAFSA